MYVSSPPDDKTESGVANHKLRFKIGPLAWACFAALDALDQLVDRMAADTLHREHDGSQRRVEHSGIHRIIDVVNGVLFLATPGISKDSFSIRSSMTQYILPRRLHRSLHPARRFLPVPLANAVRRKKGAAHHSGRPSAAANVFRMDSTPTEPGQSLWAAVLVFPGYAHAR